MVWPWQLPAPSAGGSWFDPWSLIAQLVKNPAAMRETCSIPGLGRYPGEGTGYPLQYSGLENSMDFTVHRVEKSWTQLSAFHFHFQGTRSHTPHLKDPAGPRENPRWCLQQLRSCSQVRDSCWEPAYCIWSAYCMLSAALSQHNLSGSGIAQLEVYHCQEPAWGSPSVA